MKNQFYELQPNLILSTAEKQGFVPTGELIQLNSYENRVFEIKLENRDSIIAKYYRPGRWNEKTILDEHLFTSELQKESIEVASALKLKNNSTLDTVDEIHYAFFDKVRGRMVQELTLPHFKKLGRWLARLHNVGSLHQAEHRANIGPTNDNKWLHLERMLSMVAPEVINRYETASIELFERLDEALENFDFIRLHGDLHRGNILEDSTGEFVMVDFDDMINGPEVQDFWMLMPSSDVKDSPEFDTLIECYSELREFPYEQLELIPLLRGYRIITYAMWIMNRWQDPSFPRLFPDFGSYSYWAEETENLEKILYQL
jgi:Ser/Thr protein kinase RdoA (MazF antagonist)